MGVSVAGVSMSFALRSNHPPDAITAALATHPAAAEAKDGDDEYPRPCYAAAGPGYGHVSACLVRGSSGVLLRLWLKIIIFDLPNSPPSTCSNSWLKKKAITFCLRGGGCTATRRTALDPRHNFRNLVCPLELALRWHFLFFLA